MEFTEIKFDLSLILSLWGAVLSSVLAFLKIKDAWSNRFQIEISHVFRSNPEYGNEISIQNLSGKPVLLNYMELYYQKKCMWPFKKNIELWSPEDSIVNSKIDSHSSKSFYFGGSDYFSWDGRIIYVRLYFAGKKVLVKKVGD